MTEKRYESDLTRKEKRQLEWEKIKKMTWKNRIDHIWTYYKPHMAIGLAIILALCIVGEIIYRSQFETVLNVAILNTSGGDADAMEVDFKKHISDEDKFHEIRIDSSMFFTGDEAADYTFVMKLATMMAARELEIMIAPEEKMKEYAKMEAFMPMSEILTKEQEEAYGDKVGVYSLRIEESEKLEEFGMKLSEPLYLGVVISAKHMENVKSFITYIYEGGTS